MNTRMSYTQHIMNEEHQNREPILKIWRKINEREKQSLSAEDNTSQEISEDMESSPVN